MSVPGFQDFMLPLLQAAANRKDSPFQRKDVEEEIIQKLKLSEEDLSEVYPGTTSLRYIGRLGWALTYLFQAGLLTRPKRATYQISPQGLEVIQSKPSHVDTAYLLQFPQFRDFQKRSKPTNGKSTPNQVTVSCSDLNPDEQMAQAFEEIQGSLAQDLLDRLTKATPSFFERIVVELLVKMGYGGSFQDAARAVGKSHDGGIDGIIKEDKLGLDAIYLQAKRYDPGSSIGRPAIQQFAGALQGHRATKGVFLTTARYSKEAIEFAKHSTTKIILIDGETLVRYMIEYDLGVSPKNTFIIKRIDEDFFEEE